jgi:hypothetical protein
MKEPDGFLAWKTGSDEQERRLSGSEFHIVGVAKAKDRRPSVCVCVCVCVWVGVYRRCHNEDD